MKLKGINGPAVAGSEGCDGRFSPCLGVAGADMALLKGVDEGLLPPLDHERKTFFASHNFCSSILFLFFLVWTGARRSRARRRRKMSSPRRRRLEQLPMRMLLPASTPIQW